MTMTRHAKRTRNRSHVRRITRKARRKVVKRSTFMKLRRRARNPGADAIYTKHFRSGGRVEVWNDGGVVVYDAFEHDPEEYFIKPYEVKRFIAEIKDAGKNADWHHYSKDMVRGEFEFQGRGRNPGKRSKRSRRNPRWARPNENDIPTVRITRRNCGRNPGPIYTRFLADGSTIEVHHGGLVEVTDRGQPFSRFVIPFSHLHNFIKTLQSAGMRHDKYDFSADDIVAEGSYGARYNPGKRRSKARGKKRSKSRSKARRNPKIPKRDARALKRVLRKHGYSCRR